MSLIVSDTHNGNRTRSLPRERAIAGALEVERILPTIVSG
jgi:hypothetical protein